MALLHIKLLKYLQNHKGCRFKSEDLVNQTRIKWGKKMSTEKYPLSTYFKRSAVHRETLPCINITDLMYCCAFRTVLMVAKYFLSCEVTKYVLKSMGLNCVWRKTSRFYNEYSIKIRHHQSWKRYWWVDNYFVWAY